MYKQLKLIFVFAICGSCGSNLSKSSNFLEDRMDKSYDSLVDSLNNALNASIYDSLIVDTIINDGDKLNLVGYYSSQNTLLKIKRAMKEDSEKIVGFASYYLYENGSLFAEVRSDSIIKLFSKDSLTYFYESRNGQLVQYDNSAKGENRLQQTHHFRMANEEKEKFMHYLLK